MSLTEYERNLICQGERKITIEKYRVRVTFIASIVLPIAVWFLGNSIKQSEVLRAQSENIAKINSDTVNLQEQELARDILVNILDGELPSRTIWLSILNPISQSNIHGGLGLDRPYWGDEVLVGGVKYSRAIVTHAPATGTGEVRYLVPENVSVFQATVALADDEQCEIGAVDYSVAVDGMSKISGMIERGRSEQVEVPVSPQSTLSLQVENNDGTHVCDTFVWANAVFLE